MTRNRMNPQKMVESLKISPNCHARCDQWDLELRLEDIRQIPEHRISAESLEYHSQQQRSLYGDTVSFTG